MGGFRDASALAALLAALIGPFRRSGVSAVAGIESRGFPLGGACAAAPDVGFVPVRKEGALFPGSKLRESTTANYRGRVSELLLQRSSVSPGEGAVGR